VTTVYDERIATVWARKVWVLLLALAAMFALACEAGVVEAPPSSGPGGGGGGGLTVMAALGDSVTVAFSSCIAPSPCPRNSWSTGDGTKVNSHYRRLLDGNPGLRGNGHNFAAPRARADALAGQAEQAAKLSPGYVTVLIGANDACHGQIGDMTPVDTFRLQIDQGLAVIKRAAPQARVLVVSIPDIRRLWDIGHNSRPAVKAWSFGICPALLLNPTSMAQADVDRRQGRRLQHRARGGLQGLRAPVPRRRGSGASRHIHPRHGHRPGLLPPQRHRPERPGQGILAGSADLVGAGAVRRR